MNEHSYVVTEVTVAARSVAGVRMQVPRGRVAERFATALNQVYAAGRSGAVVLDRQNIFIYGVGTRELLSVDFCVGAAHPFDAIGDVVPLHTPHGTAAMTTHWGDYGRLMEANTAIAAWCAANDRQCAGPSWEVYGHWHDDPSQRRTDVYWLLQTSGCDPDQRRRSF